MYIVRNQEIIELKSDKIPIGKGIKTATTVDYTNHAFTLEKGDMLYLFSDGFADQKGGPDSKKFYYPPFRKLLVEISKQSPAMQQKELERNILTWKGDLEQYDDMLILGVKIQ
jgi:serine phosphatase RsbU (regulator of sigma subunit)